MIWRFTIRLKDIDALSDNLMEALFASGCTDAVPASSCGEAWIDFDREAKTLEEAMRSAVHDVRQIGLKIARVEVEEEAFAGT